MMNYGLFKTIIQSRIKEFLPYGFAQYRVSVDPVYKANARHDCMTVAPVVKGDSNICPCIYLDEWYDAFKETEDMDHILKTIADMIVQYSATYKGDLSLDLTKRKDSIVMNILNTKRNGEYLKTVPHRDHLDFSIMYRIIMMSDESGFGTIPITHGIARSLELSEEELFELAMENTKRLFPRKIVTIREMTLGETCTDEETWDMIAGSKVPFVVTNRSYLHGAAQLMYKSELKNIADHIGNNYYAVPSSVNEFFVIPDSHVRLDDMKKQLLKDNSDPAFQKDILSDNIYYYDRNKEKLMIA